MAERGTPPMDHHTAEVWRAYHGCSVGLRDAAIINKLQLTGQDKHILHVGCGYGTLLVALYKCIRAITDDEAKIVGIDHCLTLLHESNGCIQQLKDASQDRVDDISRTVEVHLMDVMNMTNAENIQKIRSCFPDGPKVIIAVGVFDDLANPAAQAAIRNLVALQPQGGRFIVGTHHQPVSCGSINLFKRINQRAHPVGVLNLVPEDCERKLKDAARHLIEQIEGHSNISSPEEHARNHGPQPPGDPPVPDDQHISIYNLRPEVMGGVLENFIRRTTLFNDRPYSVRLSHEASFFHNLDPHCRMVNSSRPEIRYIDVSEEYTAAVAEYLTTVEKRLQIEHDVPRWKQRTERFIRTRLESTFREYDGLDNLNFLFFQYLYPENEPTPSNYTPHVNAARDVIRKDLVQIICNRFHDDWDWFQVAPALVLTSFVKG